MREGVLIYDHESGRMDIRFGLLDFYIDGKWIPTRIELGSFWYLRGIRVANLNGLHVRIKD